MSEKISQLAPQILEVIQTSKNILLHCHPSPDPDSVGSVLAMMHALRTLGKNVTVIAGDSEIPQAFSSLPGFDQIVKKNYFEIDLSKFDLFLILDSSSLNMVSSKGKVIFPDNLKTVVIDHHSSNSGFAQVNLVETTYPATTQIIFDLLKTWNINISSDIAACLILGLYTDTGGFQYLPNNPSYTFEVAKELSAIYPEFPKLIFQLDNSNDAGRIIFEGLALSSIKLYFNHQVAISEIRLKDWKNKGVTLEDTQKSDVANKLKSVIGWEIGISFIEREKDLVNVSMRTRDSDKYDLSKLATSLGGGGHKAAAGATINKPFDEAKRLLLENIKNCYPDLSQV